MTTPPKTVPPSQPSQAGGGAEALAPTSDASPADAGALSSLIAAALHWARLREAESQAGRESAPKNASARAAPSRAAVVAAEHRLLDACRGLL